jgi:hypothetical protein
MFRQNSSLSASRWRGFLISAVIHALAASLIFLAVRNTHVTSKGTGFQDTLAPDTEVTITMWDEPAHIGPINIKPILIEPSGPKVADTLPLLKPIDPISPIVPQPVAPMADPNIRPADYAPAPPPPPAINNVPPSANPPAPKALVANPTGNGGASGSSARESRLPVSTTAKSVVFVLDRSASMGIDDRLTAARKEILAALSRMPAGTKFQVVVYNRTCETVTLGGQRELAALSSQTLKDMDDSLKELTPEGGNDHLPAMRSALYLQPEVICLLTDADDLTLEMVQIVTRFNQGRCVIHAVVLGSAPRTPMQLLAKWNRGTCREIDP